MGFTTTLVTPELPQRVGVDLELVMRQARPYNNVSEIPKKMPQGFFDSIDADALVEWIKEGFKANPPSENSKRELLFTGLDVAAIASEKEEFAPLVNLKIESTRKVYQKLKNSEPTNHLTLYKLYNEGVIVRAPGVCFGVDIVLNTQNDDIAPGFAEILDGLLITHAHGDHFDYQSQLHPELKEAGKPIILPEDDDSVPLGGTLTSGKLGSLDWTAFRGGHVNLHFSSFFYLKIGQWKILHSGDNTVWMDFAKSAYAKDIDIFLLKPESLYVGREEHDGIQEAMEETLREIHPRILIPHHLLELGHGLGAYGHDMGFRLYQQAPKGVDVQMLQWGEFLRVKELSRKT